MSLASHLSLSSLLLAAASVAAPAATMASEAAPPAHEATQERGVDAFYAERGGQPFWFGPRGAGPHAGVLLERLSNAASEGLDPADYDPQQLAEAIRDAEAQRTDWRAVERRLSQTMVRYLSDLRYGRVENKIDFTEPGMAPEPPAPADVLASAASASSFEQWFAQQHRLNPVYDGLRDALAQVRNGNGADAQPLIGEGDLLRQGDRSPRVERLRERLGLPVPQSGANRYDSQVAAAVESFQREHGLSADGVLGPNTRAMLNQPPGEQERTLIANMERARWLPDALGDRYVMVNIPGYTVRMYEGDRAVQEMAVVVGTEYDRTPLMADRMEYLEINPYWNIPNSITSEEIAPAVRANGVGYLQSRNMEVVRSFTPSADVLNPGAMNWASAAAGDPNLLVRQRPGPDNALGRIKFMFPNPHAIYLHDTPADQLFENSSRSESHGCVRVERPIDLAMWALTQDGWDRARLRQAIDSGDNQQVQLQREIPVYLTYFTAWPQPDGSISYRPDIYDRDSALISELG
ncbi:L,D-transpeptidase family protein [Sphingosinithalassobacter sp. LHW66-3]|uniref:L,D-transpeptidase family protein n=1 Tax=Sphingosinithalassobacter sp. LHW66-3 TaxID=3424718 RepID=UPI003D6C4FED